MNMNSKKKDPSYSAKPQVTAPPVHYQDPNSQTNLQVSFVRWDLRFKIFLLRFAIFALLLLVGYTVFTILSMVPQARDHFYDVFFHPSLKYFLAS